MKKLSTKNIIEFRKKTPKGKKTLVYNAKYPKKRAPGEGGDYWTSSTSALSNAFKEKDNQIIKDKIEDLLDRYKLTPHSRTKTMYERNIQILRNYENFDFSKWQPTEVLSFHSTPWSKSIIDINGLPIQAIPNQVFSFDNDETPTIGAIWFVVKLDKYKIGELGIFTDVLYKYLTLHYSTDYNIDPNYCFTVDILDSVETKYSDILSKKIPSLLEVTIDDVKTYI